ncbi:MAG: hypothetical protein GY754_36875 [bacterium]|nr:hypothetical protein [bacterium]
MDAFFNPQSLAIIGASNRKFNLGATICSTLKHLNFDKPIYTVNRKGEDVLGCKGFTSLHDIPGEIDLAIIIVPARVAPNIMEECGKKGITNVIIETSEFSEAGEEGKLLQDQISEIAIQYNIRFIGPNCLGVLNTHNNFNSFFGVKPGLYDKIFKRPGTISYVIQSGVIGTIIMDSFNHEVGNTNKMVCIGNKEDINEADLLDYFNKDNTEVIGMYLESIKNYDRFLEAAKRSTKPILIYKSGRTSAGAEAALHHTASPSSNETLFDKEGANAGLIRVNTITELHSMPKIFTRMPLLKGKRIAIFTNSGAFGGISSDLLIETGFEVPALSKELQEKLINTGRLFNASNPIDLGPTLARQTFRDIFNILLSSDEIDGLLAIPNIWKHTVTEAVLELEDICREYGKPAAIYIPHAVERILTIRKEYNIPSFTSAEEAVRALSISYNYYLTKRRNHRGGKNE